MFAGSLQVEMRELETSSQKKKKAKTISLNKCCLIEEGCVWHFAKWRCEKFSLSLRRRLAKFPYLKLKLNARFYGFEVANPSPYNSLFFSVLWSALLSISIFLSLSILLAYLCICFVVPSHLYPFCVCFVLNQTDCTCIYGRTNIPITGLSVTHRPDIKILPDGMCPRDLKRWAAKTEFPFKWRLYFLSLHTLRPDERFPSKTYTATHTDMSRLLYGHIHI